MTRFITYLLPIVFMLMLALPASAQSMPSGSLDFGVDFHYSMNKKSVLGTHARAMAVDRVPGTLVGRFGELYASLGVGLDGKLIEYSLGLKLGVGLGVEHFVFFVGSGLMCDAYHAISESGEADEVAPGLGIPITIGFWIDPSPKWYFYLIAEPSWSLFANGVVDVDKNPRKTTPFLPFSFAWELRLRGGVGFDISNLHMRIDYTFHQVHPHSWHVISIGFGFSSQSMAALSQESIMTQ